jgi:hypothetical protein
MLGDHDTALDELFDRSDDSGLREAGSPVQLAAGRGRDAVAYLTEGDIIAISLEAESAAHQV